jgi:predicted flap endonuclease-1-like 5' DNA nuclease
MTTAMANKNPNPDHDQLPKIGAPATRALAEAGITQLSHLNGMRETDLLKLHGVGPKAIQILREAGVIFASNHDGAAQRGPAK